MPYPDAGKHSRMLEFDYLLLESPAHYRAPHHMYKNHLISGCALLDRPIARLLATDAAFLDQKTAGGCSAQTADPHRLKKHRSRSKARGPAHLTARIAASLGWKDLGLWLPPARGSDPVARLAPSSCLSWPFTL